MEVTNYLQILLFVLCGIDGIAIIIFVFRNEDQGYDYDKYIKELNNLKKQNLKTLEDGNKEIDEIERKISDCKKKLKIKLFEK